MKPTFKGGIHVTEYKNTRGAAIETMPAPQFVTIPLSQHIGAPAAPVVAKGDYVAYAQVIGKVENGLGCPVHASVSGTVKEIKTIENTVGRSVQAVVIENDGLYTLSEEVKPFPKPLAKTTASEIVDMIREAGISGMGGATFPTYAKLQSAIGKVDTLIINCAECEPFITANHRVMLERPQEIIGGAEILMHALGLSSATIAVEDNKPDAIAKLQECTTPQIRVVALKTKYPQGDERQIIYALTKRELAGGKLPADVGCVIFNAETTAAVWHAFYHGMPLCKRVVTVDGDCIARPTNVLVHIGTSYRDLFRYCGGLIREPERVINGGPMMGFTQWNIDAPITKGASAILVFSKDFAAKGENRQVFACIRCGRCVAHCPMHLMPQMLVQLSQQRRYEDMKEFNVMSCVECGTCSYGCPGSMPIVEYIRVAKAALRAAAMKGGDKK